MAGDLGKNLFETEFPSGLGGVESELKPSALATHTTRGHTQTQMYVVRDYQVRRIITREIY